MIEMYAKENYSPKQALHLAGFNAIGVGASVAGIIHPIWAMITMALSVTTV